LVRQPFSGKQVGPPPAAVASQGDISIAHAGLPVPLHPAFVDDGDSETQRGQARENGRHKDLGSHVTKKMVMKKMS